MKKCCGSCINWRKYPAKVQKECGLPHPIGMCKLEKLIPSCISYYDIDDMYDIDGNKCPCYDPKENKGGV